MNSNKYTPGAIQTVGLSDGTRVAIREARPGDVPGLVGLFDRLSKQTRYMRFMKYRKSISSEALARLLASSPQAVALVAEADLGGAAVLIADGRFAVDASGRSAEVGIVVQDQFQRKGLGHQVLGLLAERAKEMGIRHFTGEILADNVGMLNFVRKTGYDFEFENQGNIKRFRIDLRQVEGQSAGGVR